MISIYIQLLFMFVIFTLGGFLFQRLFLKKEIATWLNTWVGIGVLTAIVSLSHLFFATNWVTISIITLLLIAYAFFDYKNIRVFAKNTLKDVKKIHWAYYVVFFCFLLFITSLIPGNIKTYDTGLYHDQYVQSVEDYPAILGLANFFINLGFNSSWFITNAFFDNETFYVLNAFVLLLFIFTGIAGLNKLTKKGFSPSTIYQSSFLLFAPFFIRDIPSLSNDIINSMLIILLFYLGMYYFEKKSWDTVYIISFLSLFALTVKLSAIPVGVLVLFVLGFQWFTDKKFPWKKYLKIAGMSAVVIIPWVIRSIIITGYIIFPLHQIDVLDVEWKVPFDETYSTQRWIESWAKIPGQGPDMVLDNGISGWLPTWLDANLSVFIIQVLLGCIVLFGLYLLTAFPLAKSYVKTQWALLLSALFCLVFWFLKAPDVRFGYGFIVVAILVSICGLLSKILSLIPLSQKTLSMIIVIGIIFTSAYVFADMNSSLQGVGYPPLSELSQYSISQYHATVGDVDLYVPAQTDQCFNVEELCSPTMKQDKNITLLGEKFTDGMKREVS